ncbi:MAG: SsrA-binding protein SmpB [Myxococcota bacterium]|nr:SsrA-binding protein SmpB [Myxococcota bacterium]
MAKSQPNQVYRNKKAFHDYKIGDCFEAGIVLSGTEVKACREGNAHLKEAYVQIVNQEAFLINGFIGSYSKGNQFNHETTRTRKLLLHRREIDKLLIRSRDKGYTIVPIALYFKGSRLKVEIALAKGQTQVDRRQDLKKKDANREMERAMKGKLRLRS